MVVEIGRDGGEGAADYRTRVSGILNECSRFLGI